MNILFWNTYRNKHKKNIDASLVEMIIENDCDIIILAEYIDGLKELCSCVNLRSKEAYKILPNNNGCDHIKGLIKNKYRIESLIETSRYQILKLETTSYTILIGAIHNLSKWSSDENTQRVILTRLHNDIIQQEKQHGIKNSIIIGDFNINPFDSICVEADSLFALPYKNELKKATAIRNDVEYQKFYNPSWKFLSNEKTPYASYYYNNGEMVNYYWNMFDQVIMRPQLMESFDNKNFVIICKTENHNLILNEKPFKDNYSDHLPIFCKFKEEKIK